MSTTDYLIDILLLVVIFRQVRPRQLTPRAALLPTLLLIVAGIIYLRPPFTLGGNDLALLVILALAGIALGALSGMGDTVWRGGAGMLLFRAGVVSVLAWLVGMGFRLGRGAGSRPSWGTTATPGPGGGPARDVGTAQRPGRRAAPRVRHEAVLAARKPRGQAAVQAGPRGPACRRLLQPVRRAIGNDHAEHLSPPRQLGS